MAISLIPSATQAKEKSITRAKEIIASTINDAINEGKQLVFIDEELLSHATVSWLKSLDYRICCSNLISWSES